MTGGVGIDHLRAVADRVRLLALTARSPSWTRDPGVLILVGVALAGWMAAEAGGAQEGFRPSSPQLAMYLGVGALAWRVGRTRKLGRATRRAWRCVGLAIAATVAGDIAALAAHPIDRDPATVQVMCYVAAAALVLVALYTFPLAPRTRQDRLTAVLDTSIVVLGGVIATWVVLVEPGVAAGLSPSAILLRSLGSLGGLTSLVGVARLAVNQHEDSHPLPNIVFILAMLGFFTASLGAACELNIDGAWGLEPAGFAALATTFLGLAAPLQARISPARGDHHRERYGAFLVHARAALVVHLGRTFDLETVAEGIERRSQADALRAIGFEHAQGFHFSRPIPADAIAGILASQAAPTSVGGSFSRLPSAAAG